MGMKTRCINPGLTIGIVMVGRESDMIRDGRTIGNLWRTWPIAIFRMPSYIARMATAIMIATTVYGYPRVSIGGCIGVLFKREGGACSFNAFPDDEGLKIKFSGFATVVGRWGKLPVCR